MPMRMFLIVGAVLLLSVGLMIWYFDYSFYKSVENDGKRIFAQSKNDQIKIILESDLKKLPKSVGKYLKQANVIGKPMIQTVRLKQKGFMRQDAKEKWLPLESLQYFSTSIPSFSWIGKIKSSSLLFVVGKDRFINSKGSMEIKLLSTIPLGYFKGKELDLGAMTRFMNEMMWFPTSYLNDYIKWEEINDSSAKMIMNYNGLTASAVLYFDEKGRLKNFICDRYRTIGDKQVLTKWETPIEAYGERNGFNIPIKGQAVWKSESGDFAYIQLEIESIEYNKKEVY